MTQLSKVLSAYAVPLQVWISPESRKKATSILMGAIGGRASIHSNPLSVLDDLNGPAVLVITANEISAPNTEALKQLAERAHPGRAILLGGTSDRDVLMNAINQWGVIRALDANPEPQALISAIEDAESYLKREVALATAIDDLDIENTMLESAIDHLEGGAERTKEKSRSSATTTFAQGLSTLLMRERDALSNAREDLNEEMQSRIDRPIRGMEILAGLLDKTHDRAVERAANLPLLTEPLDDVISTTRELILLQGEGKIGGHLGSGVHLEVEPLALAHVLIHIADRGPYGPAQSIDSYRSGHHAVVEFRFSSPVDLSLINTHINQQAWSMLSAVDVKLGTVDADPHILRLSLKIEQDNHEQ